VFGAGAVGVPGRSEGTEDGGGGTCPERGCGDGGGNGTDCAAASDAAASAAAKIAAMKAAWHLPAMILSALRSARRCLPLIAPCGDIAADRLLCRI
jgi:hypothetical protein